MLLSMTTSHCDKCQKTIAPEARARISFGLLGLPVELCLDCAQPIIEILKNYELSDNSWQEDLPAAQEAL